jgi:hypothetical protein
MGSIAMASENYKTSKVIVFQKGYLHAYTSTNKICKIHTHCASFKTPILLRNINLQVRASWGGKFPLQLGINPLSLLSTVENIQSLRSKT